MVDNTRDRDAGRWSGPCQAVDKSPTAQLADREVRLRKLYKRSSGQHWEGGRGEDAHCQAQARPPPHGLSLPTSLGSDGLMDIRVAAWARGGPMNSQWPAPVIVPPCRLAEKKPLFPLPQPQLSAAAAMVMRSWGTWHVASSA